MGSLVKESQDLYKNIKGTFDFIKTLEDIVEKYVYEEDGTAYSNMSSSTITPGTCFMRRLNSFIVMYLANVQEKGLWGENLEIVYSGSSIEGEGEHKIISDIKKSKFTPPHEYNYNNKTQKITYSSAVKMQ